MEQYLVTSFRRLHHIHITVTSYERHGVSLRSHASSHDRGRDSYQPITPTSNEEMKTLVKLRRRCCSKTYEFLGFAEYFFLFTLDDSIKPLFYPMLIRHPHVLCHSLQYTPGIFYFFPNNSWQTSVAHTLGRGMDAFWWMPFVSSKSDRNLTFEVCHAGYKIVLYCSAISRESTVWGNGIIGL